MDDIAVVGYGAMLPEAEHAEAWWRHVLTGRSAIRPVPDTLWEQALYYSVDPQVPDKSRSACAGFVEETAIAQAARTLGVAREAYNRLQIMTLAAAEQALTPLHLARAAPGRAAVYLGCMSADDRVFQKTFCAEEWDSLRAHIERSCPDQAADLLPALWERLSRWAVDPQRDCPWLFTSSVLHLLQQRFGLAGEAALVDAACASSLAAIDLAMRALRSGRADVAVTGGIEANLGPASFVLFSRLGALAPERCLPFDRRSEGLSQGEGTVILVLERLADARRLGHPVHGLLLGCGASSDGSSSSLFAPTLEGQQRAYEQAYSGLDPQAVDYLECHATGTAVGDATELRSIRRFFGARAFPIGSVKAQLGHTKGAAGAVSLLKCLLSLKHRTVPPSPYCHDPILAEPGGPFVNREPLRLRQGGAPLTFGISSFGFGGINYHLVLQEALPGASHRRDLPHGASPAPELVLIGRQYQPVTRAGQADVAATLRIPQRSLDQIDPVQLAALLATRAAAQAYHLNFARLDRRAVTVISASTLGLDLAYAVSHRVLHGALEAPLARFDRATASTVLAHKEHLPLVTEDSAPGSLNNVIAGRIANHFDCTGASFNIDADLASFPAALRMAELWLAEQDGLVILLAVDEVYDPERFRIERPGVTCWLLASLPFAKAHDLPVEARLDHLVHSPWEPVSCI